MTSLVPSMSRNPLVSICLPTLNCGPFIEARVENLFAQSMQDWELIVCDSHSDDGSWETLGRWAGDPRVRLYQVPREGLYAGWNECLRRVSGEYVHIAAADDLIAPRFLEELVSVLEKHSDTDLALCRFDFIDLDGKRIGPDPRQRLDAAYDDWNEAAHRRPAEVDVLIHFCIGIPWTMAGSLVFRALLLEKTGLFRTDCHHDADRFWSLRASLHSDSIYLPDRLASWRYHEGQASQSHDRRWAARSLRMMRMICEECEDLIPSGWRNDPGWREKLLWKARREYLAEFGLDRRILRSSPHRLAYGALRALVREPAYLGHRLASGLSWTAPEFQDEHEFMFALAERWGVNIQPELLR